MTTWRALTLPQASPHATAAVSSSSSSSSTFAGGNTNGAVTATAASLAKSNRFKTRAVAPSSLTIPIQNMSVGELTMTVEEFNNLHQFVPKYTDQTATIMPTSVPHSDIHRRHTDLNLQMYIGDVVTETQLQRLQADGMVRDKLPVPHVYYPTRLLTTSVCTSLPPPIEMDLQHILKTYKQDDAGSYMLRVQTQLQNMLQSQNLTDSIKALRLEQEKAKEVLTITREPVAVYLNRVFSPKHELAPFEYCREINFAQAMQQLHGVTSKAARYIVPLKIVVEVITYNCTIPLEVQIASPLVLPPPSTSAGFDSNATAVGYGYQQWATCDACIQRQFVSRTYLPDRNSNDAHVTSVFASNVSDEALSGYKLVTKDWELVSPVLTSATKPGDSLCVFEITPDYNSPQLWRWLSTPPEMLLKQLENVTKADWVIKMQSPASAPTPAATATDSSLGLVVSTDVTVWSVKAYYLDVAAETQQLCLSVLNSVIKDLRARLEAVGIAEESIKQIEEGMLIENDESGKVYRPVPMQLFDYLIGQRYHQYDPNEIIMNAERVVVSLKPHGGQRSLTRAIIAGVHPDVDIKISIVGDTLPEGDDGIASRLGSAKNLEAFNHFRDKYNERNHDLEVLYTGRFKPDDAPGIRFSPKKA